ncbi:serine/threonine protein kinase [Paenibacillus curdlanolyticus YK9]|uniref:Serine/threonine protein kinase n=1 Tax=Paenibacillus curdlanolyticus YK9 TaxID=717606 RepID=E0ID24_9BACL|nr:protein kinase family protein [Paenibacillus curdlanolyticus]EFM09479.1 serine/threonine protein kinase [Paenibacillus curdlanolyticus YK9]
MFSRLSTRWKQWRRQWLDYPLRQGKMWAGRYRIEQFIGMGSYGQAYRCIDMQTGAVVLMKRAKPSKHAIGREMLKRESEMMRQLTHPQIPRWLGNVKHRRESSLIMAFMDGYNLEEWIMERAQTYTQADALRIVGQLISPLKHLHEAGYVHRDVRIPNVLASGERIGLIDFGLACRIGEEAPDDRMKAAEEREGEPSGFADSWGAVKQQMREPYPMSDLYGLGHLFLFLMYAGYVSVEGQEERSWEEELELEPAVKDFIRGLLEKRWQTAVECERELGAVLDAMQIS